MEKGRKYSKKPVQEFIDTVKKLKSIGVDIRDIKQRDTIEILAKRYGITIKQLEELNLNPKNKIGITKSTIACTYRGIGKHKPPTDEELKEINDLGIVLEKKSRVQNFIDNIKKLKSAKADLPEIRADDTIETLAKRAGITEKEIEKLELNPKEKIGAIKSRIACEYRKREKNNVFTEEQINEIKKLGISLEKKDSEVIKKFIEISKKLKSLGVNLSNIRVDDTVKTLALREGISDEEIEKIGLDPKFNIGIQRNRIAGSYRGVGNILPPTEEQVEEMLSLGIQLEKIQRENTVQHFIEILTSLQSINVDISKIQQKDTVSTLALKSGISEEKIEELGLDPSYKIGVKKNSIAGAYRGKGDMKAPTSEQVEELLSLGVSLEKIRGKNRTSKEIAEATIGSLNNIEMGDKEGKILKELTEKAKEKTDRNLH